MPRVERLPKGVNDGVAIDSKVFNFCQKFRCRRPHSLQWRERIERFTPHLCSFAPLQRNITA